MVRSAMNDGGKAAIHHIGQIARGEVQADLEGEQVLVYLKNTVKPFQPRSAESSSDTMDDIQDHR